MHVYILLFLCIFSVLESIIINRYLHFQTFPFTMPKMTRSAGLSQPERTISNHKYKPYHPKQHSKTNSLFSIYSPKFSIYLLITCAIIFILFQIQSLQTPSTSLLPSWTFLNQWQKVIINTSTSISTFNNDHNCNNDQDNLTKSMATKLRESVTFLPLKDLRYSSTAQQGHTWFMSSMYDTHEEGEVQYQRFPSNASKGRVLCLKGNDTHDGAWNYYALAWPETLPYNSTLKKGLTFVSYNHYNYENIWHGLSAMVPFVAWHIKKQCSLVPSRWILYHWGEVRIKMGPWLKSLMEATFGEPLHIETNYGNEESENNMIASCFEDAVVMRHNEGGMSRQKRIQVYDLLRCKARIYCNVSLEGRLSEVNKGGLPVIGMTMYLRTGPRSFNNESVVIKIFEKECQKLQGCRFIVAYSSNLTFCEQVKVMSMTDILISPHGAQLTNMFLMDKNSSVLEFFPKGWLKLAGVGQYVYHWIASWSGMKHEGAWRDPDGDPCPYSDDDRRCMAVYKGAKIGYNETYFSEWARGVLSEVRIRKKEELASKKNNSHHPTPSGCQCSS
ncbi:hypothetical protein A4A49_28200 [Nicotiana attenuata]|uniref:Glycosyltransferase 61 catalytic domain-containing protein n=2 Tax=Nicotiana attenuata TaxID=49451 RepID=A0A1J6INE5_NICAT|nr:hypothetical protein A4A49_28200 [Nicotiana attenuata]